MRNAHRYFDHHGGLPRWSPARRRLKTPLLLAHAADDPWVPYNQSVAMRHNATHGQLVRLRAGHQPWVHTSVAKADLKRLYRVERRFLRSATS